MSQQDSLGFIEAAGLTAAIMVADAMAKTADVRIIAAHKVDGLRVCVICEGDVASCKAAVDAGAAIAGDKLLLCNVIPRPAEGELTIQELLAEIPAKKAARKAERLARKCAAAPTKDNSLPVAASAVLPATDAPESLGKSLEKASEKKSEIVKSSAIPMAEAPTTPIPMAEAPSTPIPMAGPASAGAAEKVAGHEKPAGSEKPAGHEKPAGSDKPVGKAGDKKASGGEKPAKKRKK